MGATLNCCAPHDTDDTSFGYLVDFQSEHFIDDPNSPRTMKKTTPHRRQKARGVSLGHEVEGILRMFYDAQETYKETINQFKQLESAVYNEIRTYKSPPEDLITVVACAAIICGHPEMEWTKLQKWLQNSKKELIDWNYEEMDRETIENSLDYAKKCETFPDKTRMTHVSKMGYLLLLWIRAIWDMEENSVKLQKRNLHYEAMSNEFILE